MAWQSTTWRDQRVVDPVDWSLGCEPRQLGLLEKRKWCILLLAADDYVPLARHLDEFAAFVPVSPLLVLSLLSSLLLLASRRVMIKFVVAEMMMMIKLIQLPSSLSLPCRGCSSRLFPTRRGRLNNRGHVFPSPFFSNENNSNNKKHQPQIMRMVFLRNFLPPMRHFRHLCVFGDW